MAIYDLTVACISFIRRSTSAKRMPVASVSGRSASSARRQRRRASSDVSVFVHMCKLLFFVFIM